MGWEADVALRAWPRDPDPDSESSLNFPRQRHSWKSSAQHMSLATAHRQAITGTNVSHKVDATMALLPPKAPTPNTVTNINRDKNNHPKLSTTPLSATP